MRIENRIFLLTATAIAAMFVTQAGAQYQAVGNDGIAASPSCAKCSASAPVQPPNLRPPQSPAAVSPLPAKRLWLRQKPPGMLRAHAQTASPAPIKDSPAKTTCYCK